MAPKIGMWICMHLSWERVHIVIRLATESSIQNYKKMLLLKNYFSLFSLPLIKINFIRIQCIGSYTERKKMKQISWNNISSHFHAVYSWYSLFYFILLHIRSLSWPTNFISYLTSENHCYGDSWNILSFTKLALLIDEVFQLRGGSIVSGQKYQRVSVSLLNFSIILCGS